MADEDDVEALYDQGWGLIKEGMPEQALKIGQQLEANRWSGGFELQAGAYEAMDRLDVAIETLQRGITAAGGPYLLFSRLGNYLSDAGRFDEALNALDEGLKCNPTDTAILGLNRGIVLSRMTRTAEAVAEFRAIEKVAEEKGSDDAFFWQVKANLADALDGAPGDLQTLADPLEHDIFQNDEFDEPKARIAAAYAAALWKRGDKEGAGPWLERAIELDAGNTEALWLARERLAETATPGGTAYVIIVEGRLPKPAIDDGRDFTFLLTFVVVADNEKQGFEFAKPFVLAAARSSLAVKEVKILEPRTEEPKGVYRVSGYLFHEPQ